MNSFNALLIEFGTDKIPLADIADKYLGLTPEKANAYASKHKLPFPTFRGRDSQKAPRLVHAADLARYLEQQYETAKKEYRALQPA